MQILGVGFNKRYWKSLVGTLQRELSVSLIVDSLLESKKIHPQAIISTCENIVKSPPDLLVLSARGFGQIEDCLFFLSQLQLRSLQFVRCALIIEDIQEDLNFFLKNRLKVTLVNRMTFEVTHSSVFVNQSPKRFPRISINETVNSIEFYDHKQVQSQRKLDELSSFQLIPLDQIISLEIAEQSIEPQTWLSQFLADQPISANHVKGILKEDKAFST